MIMSGHFLRLISSSAKSLLCKNSVPLSPQHWQKLCNSASTLKWSKVDTKDGVTVARCKFGRSSQGHAVIKVEGVLPASPSTVYQFMQLSTKEGGKVGHMMVT